METTHGFSYYIDPRTRKQVYFQTGDDRIVRVRWSLLTDKYGRPGEDDWGDERSPEEKRSCELAYKQAVQAERDEQDRAAAQAKRTEDWAKLFHTKEELAAAPPITFAIDGFLPERGITMLGGRSGDGKTLVALDMARCLLEGSPLFGHFATHKAKRVVYLVPESGMAPFAARVKLFHLLEHADSRFFCRTLDSTEPDAPLLDPAILKACEGADVFLDTAVRFMEGEENSASDNRVFARNLFSLLRAGARTVTGLHHTPKEFAKASFMTLENVLRGSTDIGAMLAACWGIAQVDTMNTGLFIQNVKARDFEPCQPFIATGRPYIAEEGHFKMTAQPGMAGTFGQHRQTQQRGGRPVTNGKNALVEQAKAMKAEGKTVREIADALDVGHSTVGRWLTPVGF
jgi:hypothetical protein